MVATPLLAALVVIEVTDVVFAVDSVPAILAVSREPFIVFASNAFAILGLRAMYFLLGDTRERFHYLSHALGAILVFVGVKMARLALVAHPDGRVAGGHRRDRRRGHRGEHREDPAGGGAEPRRGRYRPRMKLAELVVPESTVVLTQECQKGVIGDLSLLPALAESAKTIGLVENVNRLVTTGRAAGCGVLHCIAATRDDRRGASTNAPLFQGTRRRATCPPVRVQ